MIGGPHWALAPAMAMMDPGMTLMLWNWTLESQK
jgi:hypothetical protein